MITSSISDGLRFGARLSTAWMQWATMSSDRVLLNEPRNDLASGVLRLSTITASRVTCCTPTEFADRWISPAADRAGRAGADMAQKRAITDDRLSAQDTAI